MTAAKDTPRCFKQTCGNPPVRKLTSTSGATITTCTAHLEAADNLARTGRT